MCIAECILDALGTTIDIDVVIECVACTSVNQILPIVCGNVVVHIQILIVSEVVGVRRNLFGIVVVLEQSQLVLPCSVIACTEHILLLGNLLPAVVCVVANLGLTLLTALGGNQDYTVSTTATIDGGRRSILKYGDILDIIGGDVADALNRESVDNVERVVALCDRTTTTHANLYFSVWRTFGCGNLHTRHLTSQSL